MNPPALDIEAAWVSREWNHERQLFRAQFSPDGRFVAAGGQDRLVHLWDLEKPETAPRHFEAHRSWVSSLAFHPAGELLFTADHHGVIHCWTYEEARANTPRWTISAAETGNIRALLVTPDGRHLVSAGDEGTLKAWSTVEGHLVAKLEGHRECVFGLATSPDRKHLVSGDLLGGIRQWDLTGGWKQQRSLDASLLHTRGKDFLADVGGVRSLAFSPDSRVLAAGGMKEAKSNAFCPGVPTVLLFDWTSGDIIRELHIKGKSDGPFNALRFLDNEVLAGHPELLHSDSELAFWNIGQSDPIHSVPNPSAYDLSLHPDGRQLLATCYHSSGSSGNGAQKRFEKEYLPNGATLRVYSLFPKLEAE